MLSLAWKNILHRPLNLLLTLILFALGIGLIVYLLLLNTQLREQFDSNLASVDLVIGAKGSPLQMILCSMYHIDAPTGNISVKEAAPFMKEGHPIIKEVVPLSLGDNYRGYRIVGTTPDMLPFYEAQVIQGKMWTMSGDVVIGAAVATATGLGVGDKFQSSHGLTDDADLTHEHSALHVVGVLGRTGSVIDQLLLTSYETVWDVHDHSGTEHDHEDDHHSGNTHGLHGHDHDHEHDHASHDDHGHEHAHYSGDHNGHNHAGHEHHSHSLADHQAVVYDREHLITHSDEEITSLLVRYRNRASFPSLNFARNINENTDLQAASPAIEMNRLYSIIGTGTDVLRWLALLIAGVSALSIFITLLKSMRERRYELALMRVMGGGRGSLFGLITAEGILLAVLGCALGVVLGHVAMEMTSTLLAEDYRYDFTGWRWLREEWLIIGGSVLLGLIAALIPAYQASRTDINETLGANV